MLSGRAQDGYEPLLAIADLCGAGAEARKAAVALAGTAPESENINERTLLECKRIFDAHEGDRITTADLITELRKVDDGPFGDYRGKPFDGSALARRLKPYKIRPHDIRFEGGVLKGYYRATPVETRRRGEGTFEDAWDRYSPLALHRGATYATRATGATRLRKRRRSIAASSSRAGCGFRVIHERLNPSGLLAGCRGRCGCCGCCGYGGSYARSAPPCV